MADPAGTVTVRLFAAARAAAGGRDSANLPIPPDCPLDAVLTALTSSFGSEFDRVLQRCSFLLDGIAVHERSAAVRPGQTLDVLPPFAGG